MTAWYAFLGGFLVITSATLVQAEGERVRSIHSPPHTVALLELYTSEG